MAFTRGFADSLRGAIELFLLDYRYWMRTFFVGGFVTLSHFCDTNMIVVKKLNLQASPAERAKAGAARD